MYGWSETNDILRRRFWGSHINFVEDSVLSHVVPCCWVSVAWCSITSLKTLTLCIFLSLRSSGTWCRVVWLTYTDVQRNLRQSCFSLEYGITSGIPQPTSECHVPQSCNVSSTTVRTSNLALYTAITLKRTVKVQTWPWPPHLCVCVCVNRTWIPCRFFCGCNMFLFG